MTRGTHFPPPSRPEDRFDAVLDRGRLIRRRDRMRKALVTVGTAVVVLLVIGIGVIGATRGGDRTVDPVGPSTSDPTATSVPSTEMRISVQVDDGAVEVDVDDPRAAAGDATDACVLVRLQPDAHSEIATAEAYVCWNPAAGDAPTVAPLVRVQAEVGCATAIERDPAEEASGPTTSSTSPPMTTDELHHSFRFPLPSGLDAGTYVAEVVGATGPGEPCPTAELPPGAHRATASVPVTPG